MKKPFKNEPFTDFSDPKNQAAMTAALASVKSQLGQDYPLIINGEKVQSNSVFTSINPANFTEIIGTFQQASTQHVEQAVQSALRAFESWKQVSSADRAEYLFKMADLMRQKKFELSSWMVMETAKSWAEADGDTAEAIDFLEYYGREMLRHATPAALTPFPGEKNELRMIPMGVGAIITPFNFPVAILAGMAMAAVVTGNTVVLKPSDRTPACGYQFMKLVEEINLPPGVINFITDEKADVGKYLVSHPKIRFISFTGSKKVGLEINKTAADIVEGQIWMKRVIAEMGGKDGIVVDAQANIDEAVSGVISSAFGLQGQKCSACSRVIVDEKIYKEFSTKLVEKTKNIVMGDPQNQNTVIGPLINEAALKKAQDYLEIGKNEGRLLTGGNVDASKGYFVEPTIFGDVHPKARIAQEEIFAPIVALIKAKDFDDALNIANDTEYGLTGAVYTENEQKQKRAINEFNVGNFYINRKCTGALVGVHPFGGFNMSGTDSKAGGPDYLPLFMLAKTISVKT